MVGCTAAAAGVVVAGGLFLGTAAANGTAILTPAGVSANATGTPNPVPSPVYKVNANGLTYGSAAISDKPEDEPQLIAAVATNGVTGCVKRSELEAADGTTAQKSFKSPADAVSWQETQGQASKTVPVYAEDGTTVIGQFKITGVAEEKQEEAAVAAADSIIK